MASKKNDPRAAAAAAQAVLDAPQKPAASTPARNRAGGTVYVFSKLEMALELQRCEERTTRMRYKQETWVEPVMVRVGPVFVVAGTNYPIGAPPPDVIWPERPQMVGGYAVTKGCPKDFWESWLKQHDQDPMVVNCLIFAEEKLENGVAKARENRSRFTGLGPLQRGRDKDGNETIVDPRQPKKVATQRVGVGRQLTEIDDFADAGEDLLAAE